MPRAGQALGGVVGGGAPRAPLRLGLLDPLALVDAAVAARLPPDALVADGRSSLERGAGESGNGRHRGVDRSLSSVASGRAARRKGTNVVPRPGETCRVPPGNS